jgi:TRAP transporter TAXI family solute receptor
MSKKEVAITSYGVGSQAFIFSAAIAEAVEKKTGIKTRVIPAGNDVGRMLPLRAGEVDLCIVTGGTGWIVSHGVFDFAAAEWGPQPLRMAWRGGNVIVGVYTRGNSDVKKIGDVKGKRVVQIPGSPTINNLIKGILAFADLTLEDCKVKQFPSHGSAGKALTQGFVDMYMFGTTGSRPMETAGSVHGIRWLELDPNDKPAWERLWKYIPWVDKIKATRYAGKEKGIKPFWTFGYPYCIWAWEKTPGDIVYTYSKAMFEGFELYKDGHPELPYWNRETLADTSGCYYPYHDGVIKMMKEKGVWTTAHDKFQQIQLDNEAKRMRLWREAQKEAKGKKIKVGRDKWKTFWWNKLVEANLLK